VVETLNTEDGPADPDWPEIEEHMHGVYGDMAFDWSDVVYYRLRPSWMTVYASDPQQLLGRLDRAASGGGEQ
jgi:hypothetical protein